MTGSDYGPGPDDMDWFTREASDGLRRMVGQFVENQLRDKPVRDRTPVRPDPKPRVDVAGDGVWAVVVDDGVVRVDRVFATELDALRANKDNVDPQRTVRFLRFDEPIG
ncbi:hypothetical protein L5G32_14535 [Gordonia sp. HY002]|uniref:hypothetical protein n=1 Tax=Gordonia zhenghanii TaxID=2911516 RepID=UPI001EF0E596|nr:hypothetical protein [Gordonia zhenghanii]MCF8571487.1 hypothetical protein [Gordonia zhenghanii]MCF8608117.1 hypothetical protein [Gordonia zhenghanii]